MIPLAHSPNISRHPFQITSLPCAPLPDPHVPFPTHSAPLCITTNPWHLLFLPKQPGHPSQPPQLAWHFSHTPITSIHPFHPKLPPVHPNWPAWCLSCTSCIFPTHIPHVFPDLDGTCYVQALRCCLPIFHKEIHWGSWKSLLFLLLFKITR